MLSRIGLCTVLRKEKSLSIKQSGRVADHTLLQQYADGSGILPQEESKESDSNNRALTPGSKNHRNRVQKEARSTAQQQWNDMVTRSSREGFPGVLSLVLNGWNWRPQEQGLLRKMTTRNEPDAAQQQLQVDGNYCQSSGVSTAHVGHQTDHNQSSF